MPFKKACLAAHNEFRAKHGAAPLELCPELNESAQAWADHLSISGEFNHSNRAADVGESIFSINNSFPYDFTGETAAHCWYEELKDYNFNDTEEEIKSKIKKVANFTQMVWCDTEKLGVGYVVSKGSCLIVAQYEPSGNILGNFKKNVLIEK